jgi:hypothetical protein
MKMTEQQKKQYKLYRSECQVSNVEPVRADFLAGDIPSWTAQAATAGR